DSIGTQLLASSEYSQRRRALAASLASHSTWAVAPERRTAPRGTTGGVLSIITGALTRVASRAEAGGLGDDVESGHLRRPERRVEGGHAGGSDSAEKQVDGLMRPTRRESSTPEP